MFTDKFKQIIANLTQSDNLQEVMVGDFVQDCIRDGADGPFIDACLEEIISCCQSVKEDLRQED